MSLSLKPSVIADLDFSTAEAYVSGNTRVRISYSRHSRHALGARADIEASLLLGSTLLTEREKQYVREAVAKVEKNASWSRVDWSRATIRVSRLSGNQVRLPYTDVDGGMDRPAKEVIDYLSERLKESRVLTISQRTLLAQIAHADFTFPPAQPAQPAQPAVTGQRGLEAILAEVAASDDPNKVGGDWIARVTDEIVKTIRAREEVARDD